MQHLSISFLLRKGRKHPNGEMPLVCRIKLGVDTVEYSMSVNLLEELWDKTQKKVKSRHPEAKTINARIVQLQAKLIEYESDTRLARKCINLSDIKQLLNGDIKKSSLLVLFAKHNHDLLARIGNDYRKATYDKYELTRKKVIAFIRKKYGRDDIDLDELKHGFAIEFESFLKAEQKLDHNTVMKHVKNLKKVINQAVQQDLIVKNPLDGFKCTTREVIREFLTTEELRIMEAKTNLNPRLDAVKDVFLFCCYTGLSYADVAKLRLGYIRIENGSKIIRITRTKTDKLCTIPILPSADALITKYEPFSLTDEKGRVFPVSSNQKMNEYLKEVGTLCNIHKNITVHLARHTFATTVALGNGLSLEVIQSILGHKNIRTTQIYAKMDVQRVQHEMEQLGKKLSKSTNSTENGIWNSSYRVTQ